MDSVGALLARNRICEVRFAATVTSSPHFFYGRNTRSEHEAFRVRCDDGAKVEIVDNVDIAPPVPVNPGDRIVVQGELVPRGSHGPLVHYTHHDPQGTHVGGFIDWNGRRYA
jgi:Protein of unknown function (DUF3465)